jgi:hypothetical protein
MNSALVRGRRNGRGARGGAPARDVASSCVASDGSRARVRAARDRARRAAAGNVAASSGSGTIDGARARGAAINACARVGRDGHRAGNPRGTGEPRAAARAGEDADPAAACPGIAAERRAWIDCGVGAGVPTCVGHEGAGVDVCGGVRRAVARAERRLLRGIPRGLVVRVLRDHIRRGVRLDRSILRARGRHPLVTGSDDVGSSVGRS